MTRFTIKQMMGSTVLAGIIFTTYLWLKSRGESSLLMPKNSAILLALGAAMGGAYDNLCGRPFRGAAIGFVTVLVLLLGLHVLRFTYFARYIFSTP